MYVCMCVCVCVCLLMKGSISFDSNNTKFTQKIDECSGRVMHYILPKTVQNWLKNQFSIKGSVYFKLLNVACMYMCLFVCYEKGSITFDLKNATFTQKIDDCI